MEVLMKWFLSDQKLKNWGGWLQEKRMLNFEIQTIQNFLAGKNVSASARA